MNEKYDAVLDALREEDNELGTPVNLIKGLKRWRAALAKVKADPTYIANIVLIGDSLGEGYISDASVANYITKGYAGQIISDFATKYGDVGTGMIHPFYPYDSHIWSTTFGATGSTDAGICGQMLFSNTNGNTITIPFNGTGIEIITYKNPDGGTMTYSVDGGAKTGTINCYNAGWDYKAVDSITGLSDGNHTIVLTKSNDNKYCKVLGAIPLKGTNGVRLHRSCVFGMKAEHFVAFDTILDAEIDIHNPNLTIISLTSNDYAGQTPLNTYKEQIQTMITRALQYGDVMLVSLGMRGEVKTIPYSDYVNVLKELAETNGCCYLDVYNRWGANFAYADDTLGFYASDNVHFNTIGHREVANAILEIINPR